MGMQVLFSMTCEGSGAIAHSWADHQADTWVASPAFWLGAGGSYTCSFWQRVGNGGFQENMSTYIWKGDPAGFSKGSAILLWAGEGLNNTSCINRSNVFSPTETGSDYHVIFYCTSPADSYEAIWDTLLVSGSPTLVELTSFTAEGFKDHVLLTWETASEIDNAGFHLWRSHTRDGTDSKITQNLIPAEGSSISGATYTYKDTNVTPQQVYFYKLEDINTSGRRSFYGPVSAAMGGAPIPTLTEWGALLLFLLLAVVGVLALRRSCLKVSSR